MRVTRAAVALLALALAVSTVAIPAGAAQQVIGSPEISLYSPENELAPGSRTTLPVYVSNTGNLRRGGPAEHVDRVTTARAMTFEVRAGSAPIEVNTGRFPVGSVPEGTSGPYDVSLTIPEDARPGTYRLPVRVTYSYTLLVDYSGDTPEYQNGRRDVRRELAVRIRDAPRFAVVEASTTARVGGRGNTTVTLRNVGTEPAREATLRLVATGDEILLGRSRSSRAFATAWEPGTDRTFTFSTSVDADAIVRPYPLTAVVVYEEPDGIQRTSKNLTASVTPGSEQTFAVTISESSLHVGEPGSIRGTVTNTGPEAVENAVLVFTPASTTLSPVDPEAAIGRLAAGESADFAYEVSIPEGARATTQQLDLTVRYRDPRGNRQTSDPAEPTVSVRPERHWLAVSPEEANFGVDTDNRMTVRVRNVESLALTDVRARIDPRPPFTSESPSAFVDRLEAGETATLAFQLTVAEDAVPAQSSVSMNVTAERPDGEEIVVDDLVVPVTVVEEEGPSDTAVLLAGGLVVAVVLVGGWWWLRG